jgi:hypothetical protein
MSDQERHAFEAWLAKQMQREIPMDHDGPARVMARVRASTSQASVRRRERTPAAAFAFAACVVGLIAFRMAAMLAPATQTSAFTAGDAGLRDTISAFRDSMESTARLVGVAVIAPAAARIAVAHDFHGWDLRITPTVTASTGRNDGGSLSIAPGLHLSPVSERAHGSDSVPERR